MMHRTFRLAAFAAALLAAAVVVAPAPVRAAAPAEAPTPPPDLCRAATQREEGYRSMPANLLSAISLVESGRWDKARGGRVAWPWTVMAEGRGRYLPSKEEAIAEVQRLKAKGVRNIDVGCMQVNLHWHGEAFDSLEEAFDPRANAAYAAEFLTNLYAETRDWDTAAAYYHSRTPERAEYYSGKVKVALAELEGQPRAPEIDETLVRMAAIRRQIDERAQALKEKNELQKQIREAQLATARHFAETWRERRMQQYKEKRLEQEVDEILNRLGPAPQKGAAR
ncbi:transglycosylase SLT domain-containing protein [Caenispirillum bisanense]|uniref:Transglycosylase SLT domain-containing protein n=1 Tax=Caenispirillum bisanense TaxID=414052 RepID=A0A286GA46_9PROT|nr:transglycosylase SLT domain-containing protein [Caenispirillum bisanense]SOD91854.1 Transglycosylase SLT domain-containing protein [Caenispirillum bisanense]